MLRETVEITRLNGETVQIINKHKPKVVFLENVKNLVSHDKGKTFKTIIEILKKKETIEANENLYELIVSKNELLLLVCKLLDNLLYVSFLLYINANIFSNKEEFTSTISPDIGINRSETVFTASTVPKTSS